ncbi:class I tRNA ligase family protein [Nocardioides donggukensis]|uniref:class I tRNA ligase family protein n=1 Tax=Nocardioides donggukensis TaxID=2774019 RepID=UPI00191FBED2|nr:class I tRNA ligase family protein [Nocardioides donggukensis]
MSIPTSFSVPNLPGVVGAAGRYPVETPAPVPLTLAGRTVLPAGPLRVYSCGITPYDVTHVGHASTFVWADLIGSLAHATGTEVVMCRNVTDVDDVLTAAARGRGRHYDEFALTQEFLFDRDMRALAVAPPAMSPHARSHIRNVVRLAAALLEAGAAYEREGHVYFRGDAVRHASGLDEGPALAASREFGDQGDAPGRESPFDVPVWRPSPEDHPAWPSPWGWGRPGWHAECAAMAITGLGSAVDVLVGGSDLTFPHHAYQAAMAEAATGVAPFAHAVVHVGEVRMAGEKMAKSTGNLVLVRDLLERYSGPAVRLALLNRPWDQPWDCEDEEFHRGAADLERLHSAAGAGADAGSARAEVLRLLAHELDVPAALELAVAEGGAAARFLVDVLKLREATASA